MGSEGGWGLRQLREHWCENAICCVADRQTFEESAGEGSSWGGQILRKEEGTCLSERLSYRAQQVLAEWLSSSVKAYTHSALLTVDSGGRPD